MKKSILGTIFIIFVIVTSLFAVKWRTPFYLDYYKDDQFNKIDIQIKIDDRIIYNDSLTHTDFPINQCFNHPLRMGYHKLYLSSNMLDIEKEEDIFIIFNQYVSITCVGKSEHSNNRGFNIWIANRPARFE